MFLASRLENEGPFGGWQKEISTDCAFSRPSLSLLTPGSGGAASPGPAQGPRRRGLEEAPTPRADVRSPRGDRGGLGPSPGSVARLLTRKSSPSLGGVGKGVLQTVQRACVIWGDCYPFSRNPRPPPLLGGCWLDRKEQRVSGVSWGSFQRAEESYSQRW